MKKFKFMSFKKGEGRWGNVAILAVSAMVLFKAGKAASGGTNTGIIGTITSTASNTMAGIGKYLAPPNTQAPIVVRKSVGLYTNRG